MLGARATELGENMSYFSAQLKLILDYVHAALGLCKSIIFRLFIKYRPHNQALKATSLGMRVAAC